MRRIDESQRILRELGLPPAQCNKMSALTLLALCGLKLRDSWSKAKRKPCTVTKSIMDFVAKEYHAPYKPNTRETFRRQVLHQFVQARIADYNPFEPKLPTNSPRAHYAISEDALHAIRKFGSDDWHQAVLAFTQHHGSLLTAYQKKRLANLIPVQLPNGSLVSLSPGRHNQLQVAVVEQFAPRFAPGSFLVYLGDTAKKNLFLDSGKLLSLGISLNDHDKLPDLVFVDDTKKWIFLVEVVTSHGPMTPKRLMELEQIFSQCSLGRVYVSAFPDTSEFRRHIHDISWETEVWIADSPAHLIHFNGDRFFGSKVKVNDGFQENSSNEYFSGKM